MYDGRMTLEEAYGELEIAKGSPEAEVRQARNILLRVWHPDRHQHDPKLKEAAEKKTAAINVAFSLIESAGFPSLEDIPKFNPELTFEQAAKVRELELREREIAVKERLANKPTTTEWIEEKARSLFRTVVIIGCIVGLVVIVGILLIVLSNNNNSSDRQVVAIGAFIGGSILIAILRAALKPRG